MTDKDDWLGIGGNTLSSTLGMGGITPDPAQFKNCYSVQDRAMVDARLCAMASCQIHDNMRNALQTVEEKRRQQVCTNKPLTKPPGRYLTSDEGSKCVRVRPDIWNRLIDFKWRERREKELQEAEIRMQGIDTEKFRKECLEESGVIDEDVYMKLKDKGES